MGEKCLRQVQDKTAERSINTKILYRKSNVKITGYSTLYTSYYTSPGRQIQMDLANMKVKKDGGSCSYLTDLPEWTLRKYVAHKF